MTIYRASCKLHLLRPARRNWLHLFGAARPITRAELEQMRKALPWRDSLACAIMADTGLRVSDVLALRREQLADTMHVTEIKTGKRRIVHLSAATLNEARAYISTHGNPYIIPCHRSTLWRSITRTADAFGWHHISPHSLRKLYAVEYCTKHGLAATQAELQHTNISTTLAYVTDMTALQSILPGGKL